ncbi:MAG: outer membrane protein [Lentimonas sp.]|jgi:outer membrane protein
MKKTTTVFFASLFLAMGLFAQKAPIVATVDVQRVLNDYNKFQTAVEKVRASVAPVEEEMQNMQENLQAIVTEGRAAETTAKNPAASDEARQEAQAKVAELQVKLQEEQAKLRQFQQQAQQLAQRGQQEQLEPLQQKALEVVKTVAADKGIDLVLPTNAVIYSAESLEITDTIIAVLNAE